VKLFTSEISDDVLSKERAAARALRATSWWKRKRASGRCYYCSEKVPPRELTMDHLVPLVRGGTSTRHNIVTACKNCNSKKKYLLPIEWEAYLTALSEDE
jgi:5-methylcytosine-specific restriction endonuclease McrA